MKGGFRDQRSSLTSEQDYPARCGWGRVFPEPGKRAVGGGEAPGKPWEDTGSVHRVGSEAVRSPFFGRNIGNNSELGLSHRFRHAYCAPALVSSALETWDLSVIPTIPLVFVI